MAFLDVAKPKFDAALLHCKQEIAKLRTGRATPALVEDVAVDAYGQRQALKALASISIPDPHTIAIQPWDRGIIGNIEKGLRDSDMHFNPVNEGTLLRIVIPALTQESRKEIVKVLHQKLEQARIQLRTIRDEVKNSIIKAEKEKDISEDERYAQQEKLDAVVKDCNERVKVMGEEKEADIMKL